MVAGQVDILLVCLIGKIVTIETEGDVITKTQHVLTKIST